MVANGKFISVREMSGKLHFTGRAVGETLVRCGSQAWRLVVMERSSFTLYKRFRKALTGMMGLELEVTPQLVSVTGELLKWSDWLELKEAAGGASYQFSASIEEPLRSEIKQIIEAKLLEARLPLSSLQWQPYVHVQLPASIKPLTQAYQRVLGPYGISSEMGEQLVALEPMIRVKIVVAEVNRTAFEKFGIQWPETATAQLVSPENKLQIATPDWVAHALERNKLGKILASPNLICRSGKQAEFLAGGEFPVPILGYRTQNVLWKRHGVSLKIAPLVDLAGNMSVGLESEVSLIDASQTVSGIPGLLTNRIQTHFDLNKTQTIALSGLIKQEWSQGREGLPLLSRIPVLGALFSSREYQNNRTELVVFVTPEVLTEKNSQLPMPEELRSAQ